MVVAEGNFFYNLNASSSPEIEFFGANFNNKFYFQYDIPLAEMENID